MNTINWSGYEWLTQERWGTVHKDKPYCWYDPSAVQITLKGYLDLKTQYNPKDRDWETIHILTSLLYSYS